MFDNIKEYTDNKWLTGKRMEAVMTYFKAIAEHFLGIQENHK
jgi:hypothetical protein